MNELLSLFHGASYAYDQGPQRQDLSCFLDDVLQINCQLLTHIVLEELGLELPKYLRSLELYKRSCSKKIWVAKISEVTCTTVGDIYLFGEKPIKNIQDPSIKCLHLAVCVDLEPVQLIHAHRWQKNGRFTKKHQAVNVWSLADFCESKRYNTLVGIRRVIQ